MKSKKSYRNPLHIATASKPRKFKLMHAVELKFLGFKIPAD
jgi:hypothetical protein